MGFRIGEPLGREWRDELVRRPWDGGDAECGAICLEDEGGSFAAELPDGESKVGSPILSFRGVDGIWRGEGKFNDVPRLKSLKVEILSEGLIWAEVLPEYDFGGGLFLSARVCVQSGASVVMVDERFAVTACASYCLDIAKGFAPDTVNWRCHTASIGRGLGCEQRDNSFPIDRSIPGGYQLQPYHAWHLDAASWWSCYESKGGLDFVGLMELNLGEWGYELGNAGWSERQRKVWAKAECKTGFLTWLGRNHPKVVDYYEISEQIALEYLQSLKASGKLSARGHNAHLQALRHICDRINRSLGIDINPFSKADREEGASTSKQELTEAEVKTLLEVFDKPEIELLNKEEMRVMFYIGVFTGLRLAPFSNGHQ